MRVWIARTQPGADRLAQHLESRGFESLVYPVLTIERSGNAMPSGAFDIAIVLSQHAAYAVAELPAGVGPTLYAVGPATAAAVQAHSSRQVIVPDNRSSEGLLELPQLRNPKGQHVMLICGDSGRDLLPQELERRGAHVVSWPVYRRAWIIDPPSDSDWLRIDVAVAGSGEGQAAMADLWFAAGGSPDLPLLVPSERIIASAKERGWRQLLVSDGADHGAVERALRRLESSE
ncbi:MAG: uroporphyrinogen-III synthase [Pseudomonadota bacterium]